MKNEEKLTLCYELTDVDAVLVRVPLRIINGPSNIRLDLSYFSFR